MVYTRRRLPWWGVLIVIALAITLLFGLIVLVFNYLFRWSVSEYYRDSEKAFVIPAINDGFIAQGIAYDERSGCFLVTGYQNDGTASPIHVVEKSSGKTVRSVGMRTSDGDYFGHAGGVSVYGDYVYVAGGSERCLYVYSYEDVIDEAGDAFVTALGKFSLESEDGDYINAAFTTVYENKLLVGEFYREGNYETHPKHRVSLGRENRAIAVAFEFDEESEFGINPQVVEAYSLPDQIQGMCIDGDALYLSSSYGLALSKISTYSRDGAYRVKWTALGYDVDFILCDDASLLNENKIAPMSEEIEIVDGKAYVMCESASDKYIFGKFTGGKWCYATSLDFFDKD